LVVKKKFMELKQVIEALIFLSQKPITVKDIRSILNEAEGAGGAFKGARDAAIAAAIEEVKTELELANRSFTIREVAGGFHLVSRPEFAPWAKQLFEARRSSHLSQPALETLAIIAYRQPITRAEIEAVRGVSVDGVMKTLLERNLVTITGRSKAPGAPLQYGTTQRFLEHFGLRSVEDMPQAAELKLRPPPKEKEKSASTAAVSSAAPNIEAEPQVQSGGGEPQPPQAPA
jgi:segregation and condensation protein B